MAVVTTWIVPVTCQTQPVVVEWQLMTNVRTLRVAPGPGVAPGCSTPSHRLGIETPSWTDEWPGPSTHQSSSTSSVIGMEIATVKTHLSSGIVRLPTTASGSGPTEPWAAPCDVMLQPSGPGGA